MIQGFFFLTKKKIFQKKMPLNVGAIRFLYGHIARKLHEGHHAGAGDHASGRPAREGQVCTAEGVSGVRAFCHWKNSGQVRAGG